ncbi:unnamed protein product [Phaeothamnion confervicola]
MEPLGHGGNSGRNGSRWRRHRRRTSDSGLARGWRSGLSRFAQPLTADEAAAADPPTLAELEKRLQESLETARLEVRRREEAAREQTLCCICRDRAKSVLLLPCRHLCLCRQCAQHDTLGACPICRVTVMDRIAVYP